MTHALYRLGRYSARRPWRALAVWLIAAVAAIAAAAGFGSDLKDSFNAPGVDSQKATELLSEAGSDRAGLTSRVVVATDGSFTDPAAHSRLEQVMTRLEAMPHALDVSSVVSPDGSVAILTVQHPVLEELSRSDLAELKEAVADAQAATGLQVEAGGDLFFSYEEPGGTNGELLGLLAAVIILLVAFGSLVAMGLPIGIAVFGLALGTATLPLMNLLVDIPSWAPTMGSMIGLGVGIDYALFLVTRHREFLARGMTVEEAAGRAVATAGQAVVFAGGTVIIAILGLAVAGLPFLTGMAVATSLIVLIMMVASVTLLPAFLGFSGLWVNRLGIHRRGHAVATGASEGWRRWGGHVGRHAWAYTIGCTAVLVALAAPVFSLRLGFPDEGTLHQSRTERRAYDLVAEAFGPGLNGPLVIAVDLGAGAGSAPTAEALKSLVAAIGADEGIVAVAEPEVNSAAGVAVVIAFPTTAPQADATYTTVQRLRSDVFPVALAGSGLSAHVGGQTANFGDVASRVSDRLPLFIVAVVVLSFLLLMVVFRSVLVPLKAAVLNLLSIGAAYGVLVMVFQWGWGMGLIGLESTVPVVSFIPMFMFAVLFGLSMDYEVFLLSRVREEYVATGDNHHAVVAGLAGTARVITSAALIMIAVFAAFVLGNDPAVKMLGLGLATAIFVDATLVRCVLVPATMTLMGRANWWVPAWLDRVLSHIDLDGGAITEATVPAEPAEAVESGGVLAGVTVGG